MRSFGGDKVLILAHVPQQHEEGGDGGVVCLRLGIGIGIG